jgi:hypothetical protein
VASGLRELKMKYLLPGSIITLVLTTFMFALMTSAVFRELRELAVKGKSGRLD